MTDELAPGRRFGEYLVEGVLGQGGMGVVYRARHERLGRTVALKVLPVHLAGEPEFRARFTDEARTLAAIDSPHIIQVIDHGEHGGALFIATQLVTGGDLAERLERDGPLPVPAAVDLAGQVVEAVADAHRAGVLHRDVKPSNVLLTGPDDRPFAYLCDFGIARAEEAASGHTVTGGLVGTWPYLAPERFDGAPASRASDVYALGCLLWAMLSGRAPYTGTAMSVALSHRQAPIPRLAGPGAAVAGLNDVLATAMAKDPAARFTNADAMARALRHLGSLPTAELTVAAPATPVATPPAPPGPASASTAPTAGWHPTSTPDPGPQPTSGSGGRRSRGAWVAVAAVLLIVLGVAGGVLLATTSGDDDPAGAGAARAIDTSTETAPATTPETPETPRTSRTSQTPETEPRTATASDPVETTPAQPPASPPPAPPAAVRTRVGGTCPQPGVSDCYLSVRSGPSTDAAEVSVFLEGEVLTVVCIVGGTSYSSTTRGSSDRWALTSTGGYAAALFLDPVGGAVLRPC